MAIYQTIIGDNSAPAVISQLNVTPTTSAQEITPSAGVDGFAPINVSAVTSSIDSNIASGNIKDGVTILGVTGSYSGFQPTGTVNITTNGTHDVTSYATADVQVPNGTESKNITVNGTYTPTSPNIGFDSVTVAVPNGTESKNITTNGTYTPTSPNIGFNSVTVAVPNGTETKNITVNGTYTPTSPNIGFSSVTVNVPQDTFLGLTVSQIDGAQTSGIVTEGSGGTPNFTGITQVSSYGLYYEFMGKRNINGAISAPSLTTIGSNGCYYAFAYSKITSASFPVLTSLDTYGLAYFAYNVTTLTSFEAPNLQTIPNAGLMYVAAYCNNLTTVDLHNVKYVLANGLYMAFYQCPNLSWINLSSLKELGNYGMYWALCYTPLTTFSFASLDVVGSYALTWCFYNCTSLTTVYFLALKSTSFGNYTNQFNNMLSGCTDVTVHFPSNLQSVIGSWSDVINGFGGTNTHVLFDLPATS